MATDTDQSSTRRLAPDDAFSVLGNETRLAILRTLGQAERALSFSDLRDRVGVRDSGQFNYHLDKLVDHFVSKSDDEYELQRAGERVIEAVLSGAVTDNPVLERTEIDHSCHYCGAPLVMSYRQESTATYCSECAGSFDLESNRDEEAIPEDEFGFMGYLHLPPAGLKDRTPTQVHAAAFTWQLSEILPAAGGVCPRCSAKIEKSVEVCESHAAADGLCDRCGTRHAVQYTAQCTNCIFVQSGPFVLHLLGSTELLSFLTRNGINPIAPSPERMGRVVMDYEESVAEADPFEAEFTFDANGDSITLRVDDQLSVNAVEPED